MTERPPRRRLRRPILAAATAAALMAGGALVAPAAASAATATVDGVLFDWGLNNESNGGAYFGGCNFLSAGEVGNTGSAHVWTQAEGYYKTSDGDVTIVKPSADGQSLVQPTFATKCQTPSGAAVTTATDSYSQSRVQIADGTGTVDVAAGTAEIHWTGSFSVVFYGGMTYWTASDPVLTVAADGTATLTATGSGYGTSMEDQTKWEPIPAQTITLANLTGVTVDRDGFSVSPDYLGVSAPAGSQQVAQSPSNSAYWGSFPTDFVEFQDLTGQTSYWYTSGDNSIQPRKVPLPLTVTWDVPAPSAPVISAQPQAAAATLGETASLSVTASGADTYQWQSSADGSTWADITGATSATYSVAATTANAKSYRVVLTGEGGTTTSSAAALTVTVPTPTVTVSKTEGLDPEGETITVSGTGFLPNPPSTSGTRPPLAGKFTGAYVTFGKFADVWKASDGATSSARTADRSTTKWGVSAADMAIIGGAAGGAIEIAPDGTFSTTMTVTKDFTGAPATGNLGVYTYAGGGAVYAPFETYTPITFAIPAPDAPAAPTATVSGQQLTASWTAPADNGSPITGYTVTLIPASGTPVVKTVGADATSTTFDGLTPGASYTVTVAATNAGGSSAASAASAVATVPAVAPAAVTPVVTPSATSAAVAWSAVSDGGSPVTGYTVTVSSGSDVVATVPVAADQLGATVDGLDRTTDYTVTVTATNAAGSTESSAVAFTTLAELPATPLAPVASVTSDKVLSVTWTAPDDGGAPITGYAVTVYQGSDVAATKETSSNTYTNVSGLTAGTTYTVTVAAINSVGTGTESPASAPVTTYDIPEAPIVTSSVLSGTDGLTLTWEDQGDGGLEIDGHFVQLVSGEDVITGDTLDGDATTYTFTGLTPGTTYRAGVNASNRIGETEIVFGDEVTIPAVVPSAPSTPAVVAGPGTDSLVVTWAAPDYDGGAAISGYTVTVWEGANAVSTVTAAADATSATITGLAAGSYTATVAATNAAGTSEQSSASAAIELVGPAPAAEPTLLTEEEIAELIASGDLTELETAFEGYTAVIQTGASHAGQWVGVSVNSTPRFLGWFLADETGAVTVELPSDLEEGDHVLLAFDASGDVIGGSAFTVTVVDPGTGGGEGGSGAVVEPAATGTTSGSGSTALASTGLEAAPLALAALLLALLGGTGIVITRRRHARG